MKKEALFAIIFLVILVFSSGAYAAGSATGGDSTDPGNTDTQSDSSETDVQTNICEDKATRVGRIRCRLETDEKAPSDLGPEACRRLVVSNDLNRVSKERCRALYDQLGESGKNCYQRDRSGRQLATCLQDTAEFKKSDRRVAAQDPQSVRLYIVGLLYALEERVEYAYDEGKITSNDAANILDKITEAKHRVLSYNSKEEVKVAWQAVKQKWLEIEIQ